MADVAASVANGTGVLYREIAASRAGPYTIDLVPGVVNLNLYAGDGVAIMLTLTEPDDQPLPLSGVVAAHIREARPDDNPLLEFAVNLTAAGQGRALLSLTGAQTASLLENGVLAARFRGVWDVEWTPIGEEPLTLLQGDVSCVLDVTRP